MKIKNKILIILLISMLLLTIMMPHAYCEEEDFIQQMIDGMDGVQEGDTSSNSVVTGINTIFSLIRYVGTGLSLLVVMLLGIRYMTSSVEEKADIKKKAVPICIGCALIFATTNIMGIVIDIVSKI